MIYYFSATGNSKWIGEQLAEKTGDVAISITDIIKNNAEVMDPKGKAETIGIVFPVHAWAVPKYVTDFVRKLKIKKNVFTFTVATCEAEAGFAFAWLKPYMHIDSHYVLSMPNNFTVWGLHASESYNLSKIRNSASKLDGIADDIINKKHVKQNPTELGKFMKSFIIAPIFRITRSDFKFHVDKNCVGCGKCEKVCPISDIKMRESKPVWRHKHCMQCCACINNCPVHAIQYGISSQGSDRYLFPEKLL